MIVAGAPRSRPPSQCPGAVFFLTQQAHCTECLSAPALLVMMSLTEPQAAEALSNQH
jgi:hypothetical protein